MWPRIQQGFIFWVWRFFTSLIRVSFLFFMRFSFSCVILFFGICCKRINTSCHVLNTGAKICYTKVLNIDITVNANAENDVMPANKSYSSYRFHQSEAF